MPGLKVFILSLCVRVCIRECPQRPDEGVRFPGVRLKATVSCPVLVLATKLWKSSPHSSQLSHLFNFRTLTFILFYFILRLGPTQTLNNSTLYREVKVKTRKEGAHHSQPAFNDCRRLERSSVRSWKRHMLLSTEVIRRSQWHSRKVT